MGKYMGIMKKPLVANTPGKDKRGQKPDFKANVNAIQYKNAVMGRSKLPSKKGTHSNLIRD